MKKGFTMTLVLLLVVIGAYLVSGVYARYTEQVTREGTATVAKWDFVNDNPTDFEIDITETYDNSSLVSGKIAPGTYGSFDIALKNTNTETAVNVNVAIAKENVPTNLKFYTDATHTTEFTGTELNAVLAAKDATGLTKTVYWQWAYNDTADATIDEQDTADGKTANTMKVKLTITGTQAKPSTSAVTSDWK